MDDLYVIFREKLAAGVAAIHPHRWLLREAHGPLSIGFMDYSFAKISGFDEMSQPHLGRHCASTALR